MVNEKDFNENEMLEKEILDFVSHENYFAISYDKIFKRFLENNDLLLKKFLIIVLDKFLNIKLDYNNTVVFFGNTELGISNLKEKNCFIDSYVILSDGNITVHIDLEANRMPFFKVYQRNNLYINKLSTKVFEKGYNIFDNKNTYILSINFNFSPYDNKYAKDVIVNIGKITGKTYDNFSSNILFNIEFYRDLFYNQNIELSFYEMFLVMLSSKSEMELELTSEYVADNLERKKIIRTVKEMFDDGFMLSEWEKEKFEAWNLYYAKKEGHDSGYNEGHDSGYNEGHSLGYNEGYSEGLMTTIKGMLKKNISLKTISEITGKSKDEILKIKTSMLN